MLKLVSLLAVVSVLIQACSGQNVTECVPGDRIPNPNDCIFYFLCINGEYVGFRCKKIDLIVQTYFDIKTKECLVRENATCVGMPV